MDKTHRKFEKLKESIKSCGSLAVAFSGGVDSTFLLYTAASVPGGNVLAVTVSANTFPEREFSEAEEFCRENNIRQTVVKADVFSIEGFSENPVNRCYICKKSIFGHIINAAAEAGISAVAEGSNMDDTGDYRPGMAAVKEMGILSPLKEAGLYKEEIRLLSKELGLPTWNKPSYACLASRFVYGETITAEKLLMVENAERFLLDRGLKQVRVRIHGDLARIEVLPDDLSLFSDENTRNAVYGRLKELGFSYVSLDLRGYRTGSMNETIV